jgi:demethylmenaquinone methyltransferase/2-methoxy-6-polyprenyl-1,4-benzoquinol methylase
VSANHHLPRSNDRTRLNYNRLSRWYDLISSGSEKRSREMGLKKLAAQPGERILEIGFGTGHCILALAKAVGEDGRIFGIDLSDGMLAVAKARLEKAGLSKRVDLRLGDALQLPFEPSSFDGIFMSFSLELFDAVQAPRLLIRCRSALKPAGRMAVVSLARKPVAAVRIYEWFHERLPSVVDCGPIDAQAALEAAGFEIVDLTSLSMWGLPVEVVLARKGSEEKGG